MLQFTESVCIDDRQRETERERRKDREREDKTDEEKVEIKCARLHQI